MAVGAYNDAAVVQNVIVVFDMFIVVILPTVAGVNSAIHLDEIANFGSPQHR